MFERYNDEPISVWQEPFLQTFLWVLCAGGAALSWFTDPSDRWFGKWQLALWCMAGLLMLVRNRRGLSAQAARPTPLRVVIVIAPVALSLALILLSETPLFVGTAYALLLVPVAVELLWPPLPTPR